MDWNGHMLGKEWARLGWLQLGTEGVWDGLAAAGERNGLPWLQRAPEEAGCGWRLHFFWIFRGIPRH
jgi:hypothetical protein